ncbi:disulfide oxidoreductase [Bacillus salitolerans]|uniref:Probable disulfide formation protein n=1 Tax=Bacillus salitolerans TaxID=1437434 RepID=A0ABW4LWR5_9BACI
MRYTKQIETLLFISFAVSLIATLGSLYFSEILLFIPCELCWYQRILMYPLVFLLGIAVIRKEPFIIHYVLPLSIIGAGISLYHYLIQKVDILGENSISCGIVPCTGEYINWLGFITIPFLALTAFTIITILNLVLLKIERSNKH